MGNMDDDGTSFEQTSCVNGNGNAKPATNGADTPICNGHIPNSREKQQVENVAKGESEEQLLLKRLKFSAPAYTEIRTRSGGLNLKVSKPTTTRRIARCGEGKGEAIFLEDAFAFASASSLPRAGASYILYVCVRGRLKRMSKRRARSC